MKAKLFLLALCGLFVFASCDDDDNKYQPDQTITKAFDEKYPDAGKVKWETKKGYEVADFHLSGNDAEAWFDPQGKWLMTKTEINYGLLPEPVRLDLAKNAYKDWKATDFDKLERAGAATLYIIEVEQGDKEVDLYYTEDGILIKTVADSDNNDDYPVEMPQAVTAAINEMYPGATILEFDTEKNGIEVDILHNNIYKDVYFNASNEWVSTEWEVKLADVPAVVLNTLKASEYKDFRIEDVDIVEMSSGLYYQFELEQGDREVNYMIREDGSVPEKI